MAQTLRDKLAKVDWPQVSGMLFFLMVLLSMMWGYNRIVDWLMDEKQVPLRHVVVSGELKYADAQEIEKTVLDSRVGSFFNVDVNQVQKRIESLPWVYRVSVRKKWPDILNVHVIEQEVVARWNGGHLVNTYGEVFDAPLDDEVALPQLVSAEGSAADALQGFRDFNSLLSINGFNIESLSLSARQSWQLELKNGVLLKLGTEQTVERIQRFIDMYALIEKHKPLAVQTIDLRYDTGMAVSWNTTPENQ